jgi:hypothetical protein
MTKQTKDKRAIRRSNSKDGQNRQGRKGQSEDVIQRTEKTMAKQTKDKRAIRRCNSKDEQNNGKTDKGQKSNQKM